MLLGIAVLCGPGAIPFPGGADAKAYLHEASYLYVRYQESENDKTAAIKYVLSNHSNIHDVFVMFLQSCSPKAD